MKPTCNHCQAPIPAEKIIWHWMAGTCPVCERYNLLDVQAEKLEFGTVPLPKAGKTKFSLDQSGRLYIEFRRPGFRRRDWVKSVILVLILVAIVVFNADAKTEFWTPIFNAWMVVLSGILIWRLSKRMVVDSLLVDGENIRFAKRIFVFEKTWKFKLHQLLNVRANLEEIDRKGCVVFYWEGYGSLQMGPHMHAEEVAWLVNHMLALWMQFRWDTDRTRFAFEPPAKDFDAENERQRVAAMVASELDNVFFESEFMLHFRQVQVPPQLQWRRWPWGGATDHFPCWVIAVDAVHDKAIIYWEHSLLDSMWNVVTYSDREMGMPNVWFDTLDESWAALPLTRSLPVWRVRYDGFDGSREEIAQELAYDQATTMVAGRSTGKGKYYVVWW